MSRATARPFLDLRALAPLSGLRFAPCHRIEGSYSGKHQSHAQSGAGEFVDYREYASGEDLRRPRLEGPGSDRVRLISGSIKMRQTWSARSSSMPANRCDSGR